MEQQVKKNSFWSKYKFSFICFLSSLPLLALGICGMIFIFKPSADSLESLHKWLLPFFACLFSVLLEFIIIGVPLIFMSKKNKKDKKEVEKK
ncbi:MAG: hypothetical protein LBS76_02910 [Mycoplasmataceae bacterium]|jgi:hypothetical protein|nr:hypothetical protein [Mycoplasmataceae bacterium]